MIQVVLSIVSVHWRHIRPFLKFEIQILAGSFVTVRNTVLDVSGLIQGVFVFLAMFGVLWCFLCMIQVVLSIVSVHWRHIRLFENSEIQIWPLTALL